MKQFKDAISTLPPIYHRLVFSSLIALILLVPTEAKAEDSLSSFLKQLQQVVASLQTYINQYKQEFSQQWKELSGDLNNAINSTVGDLKIPDPLKAGKEIKEIVEKQNTDLTEADSETLGENAQRNWHQSYTYGLSQSILGTEGQKTQNQEAEMSNDAVSQAYNLSDNAQKDVVTQDILKKMALQNYNASIIVKSLHSEAQKQTRALSAANINLSDISSRLDEQAIQEQTNNNASAKQILGTAAFADSFWEKSK